MSNLTVRTSLEAPATKKQNTQPDCSKKTIVKTAWVVFGLLLIGGALAAHFYQVNAIAVYTMGSIGGFFILATVIASVVQCLSRSSSAAKVKKEACTPESPQLAYEEESKWVQWAQDGNIAAITEALQHQTLPAPTKLLHEAVCRGHVALVSLLLAQGADPKASDPGFLGYSALHVAVLCRDSQKGLAIMRILLEKKPSLRTVETKYEKFTPLHLAVRGDANEGRAINTQQVELLLQHGADVNANDVDANTPLHLAAQGMHYGLEPPNIDVIELLVHAGAQWDAKNTQGKTPLQVAQERHKAWSDIPEIKERLLALQLAYEEESKWVQLAQDGDIEVIKEALKDRSLPPTTLFHEAVRRGHVALVSFLIAQGADLKGISTAKGYSALHVAVCCPDSQKGLAIMRILLEKEPSLITVETKYEKLTPLHLAVMGDANENMAINAQNVELLVQHGADVNAKDVDANTPLHLAAEGMWFGVASPNIDVIELLVRAGAQWDAKNKQGKTPLQVVQESHETWSDTPEIKKRLSALSALTR